MRIITHQLPFTFNTGQNEKAFNEACREGGGCTHQKKK